MTNLFRQLPEMNWFAATHFRDKALSTQVLLIKQMTIKDWLTARNISNDQSIRILDKFLARKY